MSFKRLALITTLLVPLASGCHFPPHIYRIDVEQGNILQQSQVAKLKKGMTKSQVQAILGVSLLPHFFHRDRWDYYYSFVPGNSDKTIEKHLELHFKKDKLTSIQYSDNETDE